MAGERTPDTSDNRTTGSSDDDISLREHMQRQIETEHRYASREVHRLQELTERRLHDIRDLLDERFMAQQHAVDELKTTTAQRFESVNEFRGQLNDQARLFMGRDESISRHERTTENITALTLRHDNDMRVLRERMEADIKAAVDRHNTDMAQVNSRLDLNQGKGSGLNAAWGYLIGVIGLASAIIGIIIGTR